MTDEQIIKTTQEGDNSKFSLLVEKYQTRIFHTVMGFVHSRETAEDLTQDIFISAFQSISKFKGDSEFSTWIFRIAVNLSLNHIEKYQRKNLIQSLGELTHNEFESSGDNETPEQQMIVNERDTAIRMAIDSLSDKQHTAFVLSKYDELSQKEIALIMQISEGAVEQHLQRAKINLQKKLAWLVGK